MPPGGTAGALKEGGEYIQILSGLYTLSKSLITSIGVIPVFSVLFKTLKLIEQDNFPVNHPFLLDKNLVHLNIILM